MGQAWQLKRVRKWLRREWVQEQEQQRVLGQEQQRVLGQEQEQQRKRGRIQQQQQQSLLVLAQRAFGLPALVPCGPARPRPRTRLDVSAAGCFVADSRCSAVA